MLEHESVKKMAEAPGVYLIHDSQGRVIYVGKAKSLKKRVGSYLRPGGDGRALMPYLQREAHSVETIIVTNEAEALLLENNLIKLHQPKYNILLKDDKSYMALKLAKKGEWPRLELVRYREARQESADLFGPYSALGAKELAQLIGETAGLRRCSDQELAHRSRPCLLYHMKRCLAPCKKLCSKEQYKEQVLLARELLAGRSEQLLKHLDRKIESASEAMDFEQAAQWHQMQQRITKACAPQSVDLPSSYDAELLHLERDTRSRVCMGRVSFRGGKMVQMSTQIYDSVGENPLELLQQIALQYLSSVQLPKGCEVWIDLPAQPMRALQQSLDNLGYRFDLKVPTRGRALQWRELARRNCQDRLSQRSQESCYEELEELKQALKLENMPVWIEAVDTSHHHGSEHVASIVAFMQGQPSKSHYRRYKTLEAAGDDYAAMRCALERRFERAKREGRWPDLLILDGGAAHLQIALELLAHFDLLAIDLLAISKQQGNHSRGLNWELVHRPGAQPYSIDPRDRSLQLLQRIRDEAHRFAIAYHHKRDATHLARSVLDDIPGIGPKKKALLLRHFGSVAALRRASCEQLEQLPLLSEADRRRLVEFLNIQFKSLPLE